MHKATYLYKYLPHNRELFDNHYHQDPFLKFHNLRRPDLALKKLVQVFCVYCVKILDQFHISFDHQVPKYNIT
jgi:hypothetical protein